MLGDTLGDGDDEGNLGVEGLLDTSGGEGRARQGQLVSTDRDVS